MGIANVKKVIANWHALPHLAYRALTYMAVRSMDADNPPVYRAGWEELALAIGRPVPDADIDDKTVTRARKAAQTAVNRALKVLIQQGAIEIQTLPAPGRNTAWALNLDYPTLYTERRPSDAQRSTPSGPTLYTQRAERSTPSGPTLYTQRRPSSIKEYLGVLEEVIEEDGGDLPADAAAPTAEETESKHPDFVDVVEVPPERTPLRVVAGGGQTTPTRPALWPVAVPTPTPIADAPAVPVRPASARQAAIAAMRSNLAAVAAKPKPQRRKRHA